MRKLIKQIVVFLVVILTSLLLTGSLSPQAKASTPNNDTQSDSFLSFVGHEITSFISSQFHTIEHAIVAVLPGDNSGGNTNASGHFVILASNTPKHTPLVYSVSQKKVLAAATATGVNQSSQQGLSLPQGLTLDSLPTNTVNLLHNSSFEEQTNGQPTDWNYQLDSTTGNTFISQEGNRSGVFGLKFVGGGTGNLGLSHPNVKTVPGRTYTLSLYVKATTVPSSTMLRFGFWNEYLNQEGQMRVISLPATEDWTRYSVTVTTPGLITDPKNEFPLIEVEGLTTGAVYLDDAQLTEGSIPVTYDSSQAYNSTYGVGDGSVTFSPGGDIYPTYPGTGQLGSSTNQFSGLNLTNASIDTNGNLSLKGGGTVNGGLTVGGSLTVNGSTTFTGNNVFQNPLVFSSYGAGILHSNGSGNITSSAVNLGTSDVTGTVGVSNGGTGKTSFTANGLLYGNGTNGIVALTPGNSGYLLQSNGPNAAPSWFAPTGVTSSFAGLTSGTNGTATMTVGSGAILNYTGTGVLNANQLLGGTWAVPGTIGSTTPNTGAFTTLSATGITGTTFNGLAITSNGTNTLNIAAGKTLAVNNTLTFIGSDGTTFTLPSANDTLVGRSSTDTLTNKTITAGTNTISGLTNSNLSGSAGISNANLANSSVTINTSGSLSGGGAVSLGGALTLSCPTCVITSSNLFTLAASSGSNSTISQGGTVTLAAGSNIATTNNGLGTVTIATSATPSFTTVNGLTITNNSSNTLNIASGKTVTLNNSLTLAGTDGTTFTLPTTSGNVITSSNLSAITQTGTIASGVWNGTAVGTQYGGTGQNFSAATQGSLPYFSATGTMTTLTPGTSGYVLQTNGTGANPSWVAPSSITAGNVAFSGISSGTNTTAAMIVGSGGSFDYTGSGTINASSLTGNTWAIPGTIGSTTPNTGAFTTLTGTTVNGLTITNNGTNTLNIAAGKTLAVNNSITLSGTDGTTFTFPTATDTLVGRSSTDTLTNKTIAAGSNTISGLTNSNLSGSAGIANGNLANSSLTITAGTGLTGGGSVALGSAITLNNAGVLSLAGTTNQVSVSGATGNVTLSLPQNINSGASPTFASLNLTNTSNQIAFGTTNVGTLSWNPSTTRTITFPDVSGIAITTGNLSAITQTGAITSGTWNGTAIGTQYGGTGQNWSGVTQGNLPFFSGTGTLTTLAPGTSGYLLQTNGTGANPSWVAANSVTAGNVPFSGITNGSNTTAAMTVGTGGSLNYSGSGTINASSLSGNTWAIPGAIGATTPNTGAFTTLAASGAVTFSGYGAGILHSDSNGNITSSAVNLANGDVTSILGVANGGTGSNNGSITGTSGLVFASGGSNQNITLTPSGTGFVILNGNVGIGTSTPFSPLHIEANATDTTQGSSLLVDGTLASGTNSQTGIATQPNVIPGTVSNRTYDGIYSQPYLDTSNLTNGTVEGINSGIQYNGTATLGTANGGYFQNVNNSTGTITTSDGLYIDNPVNNGTITTNYGLYIANQSAGATNYALYSAGGQSYFAGNVSIGTTNPLNSAGLDIEKNSLGNAALVANNTGGQGDIFTASSSGSTKFVINNQGNVGIGITTPNSPLHVINTSAGATSTALTIGNASTTNNTGSQIKFNLSATNINYSAVIAAVRTNSIGNLATYLSFGTNAGTGSPGTTEVLRLSEFGGAGFETSAIGNASLVVNQPHSSGDIFSASQSGTTKFTIDNSGNITGAGNLAINGGSLTSTQTTFNLINATPTTINFGGAATALNIGANSGSTAINNNLVLNSSTATTTFGGIAYTWPTSGQNNGYVLSTNGSGTLSWVSNGGASNYWQLNSGILSPATITNTLTVGTTLGGNGELVINQPNSSGDIFSASQSGSTKFKINNSGNVGINNAASTTNRLTINNITTVTAGTNLAQLLIGTGADANVGLTIEANSGTQTGDLMEFKGSGGGTSAWITPSGGLNTNDHLRVGNANQPVGNQAFIAQGSGNTGLLIFGNAAQNADFLQLENNASTVLDTVNAFGQFGVGTSSAGLGNAQLVINQPNTAGNIFSASQSGTTLFNIDNSGNTRVVASLCVKATFSTACAGNTAGTIYASNTTVQSADVAENYVSSQSLEPGDVIMPANDGDNQAVVKTSGAYQSQTIGLVSTNPGVTLNSDATTDSTHPNKYPIALQGRVPVKVSSINGNIQTGDLLTSSSIPGVAMKATSAGTILGKALESYSSSDPNAVNKIMVFVNISWADPNRQIVLTDTGDLSVNGQVVGQTVPTVPNNNPAFEAATNVPGSTNQNGVSEHQFTSLSTTVSGLQSQIASMSSQLGKIADLSTQLANLQKTVNLNQALAGTGTQSAVLGASTTNNDMTIGGKLNVLGRTVLSDLGVTGTINTGLLTINGMDMALATPAATINSVSAPLMIQSLGAAGVDFENGKVTIDTNGNIVTQGNITAKTVQADQYAANASGDNASVGEAAIPTGQTSVVIKTTAVTTKSHIFTSLETVSNIPLVITKQINGTSFTVGIAEPLQQNIHFSWWIVNEK